MSDAFETTNPDTTPTRVVDNVDIIGIVGGSIDLTLTTNQIVSVTPLRVEHVVAARLRFNLAIATALRDRLNEQIGALTKPDTRPN